MAGEGTPSQRDALGEIGNTRDSFIARDETEEGFSPEIDGVRLRDTTARPRHSTPSGRVDSGVGPSSGDTDRFART